MRTIRVIQSAALLDLADELAGRNAGRGAPRSTALRRSVSTAYYAVFHKLSQHTASRLLGDDSWSRVHASAARRITHTDLAASADGANGRGNQALRTALGQVDPRVADTAQDSIDLQAARHQADDDDYFELSKAVTLSYVDAARRAVSTAVALYRTDEPSYSRFLGLALGGVKVAKAR